MERTEWPTRAHLAELREQGIAPISITALRCISVLAIFVGILLSAGAAGRLLKTWRASIQEGLIQRASLESMAGEVARLLVFPIAAAFVLAVIAGLLQSRFMFRFDRLAVNGAKFNGLRFFQLGAIGARLLGGVFVAVLSGAAAVFWFEYLLPVVLSVPQLTNDGARDFTVLLARAAAVWIVPGLGALTVITWVGSWIYFMHTHRMTRRELEAEARE